jgi:hypothetical protein
MLRCAKFEFSCVFKKDTDNGPEVNVRFVYGMRTIGRGQKPAKLLCSVMGLLSPPTKFGPINKVLGTVLRTTAEASMQVAVEEADSDNNEEDSPRDLVCAIDGSWQKRGHTSHNGVVTLTSVDTGKVLDVECLSNYCQGCVVNN